jgi:hypothetical protein
LSRAGVGIEIGVFGIVEIAGVIIGVVVEAVEIGAARGVVSSYARHGKIVSRPILLIKLLRGRTTNRITRKNNKRSLVIASLASSWTRFYRSVRVRPTVISLREAIMASVP